MILTGVGCQPALLSPHRAKVNYPCPGVPWVQVQEGEGKGLGNFVKIASCCLAGGNKASCHLPAGDGIFNFDFHILIQELSKLREHQSLWRAC